MKADNFEQYFPLPYRIIFYGDGVHYIDTESDNGFWIMEDREGDAVKEQDTKEGRAALEYMVKCANLFPEAVELLKAAQETMNEACTVCAEDLGERCATCDREEIDRRITALLAKLEGGIDNAPNS